MAVMDKAEKIRLEIAELKKKTKLKVFIVKHIQQEYCLFGEISQALKIQIEV